MNDLAYMRRALDLAIQGAGFVTPNPMVGAVVVKDNRVVGEGYHQVAGGPHAEVNALDAAGPQAKGATLYVTLEPCNHQGRTPPCTQKIIDSGIQRVVSAMADPNPHVTGGGHGFLRDRGIEVVSGVCETESRQINESFIKHTQTKLPFVVLKMAATLDGRIATRTGDAHWVSGDASRAKVHYMRHTMDAILVGSGTVAADDPKLTARLADGTGQDPIRIILDTHLNIRETAKVLDGTSPAATYLVCAPETMPDRKERLAAAGARILETPLKNGRIDLSLLMQRLGGMDITSVLIEGGAQVAGNALENDVVDKVALFYAPKLLVSDQAVPMCRGLGPKMMRNALTLDRVNVVRVAEDILIEGYRH